MGMPRLNVACSYRLTSLRFCCAANVVTASEARDPDGYRDCSNRLLGGGHVTFNLIQVINYPGLAVKLKDGACETRQPLTVGG